MRLSQLLPADRVILGLKVKNKAQLLDELSRRAAVTVPLRSGVISTALAERERLGSTGLGNGFALPHASLKYAGEPYGLLVRLTRPIEFEAIDGKPVNTVFLLLNPEEAANQHVASLAMVARLMRDPATLPLIRKAAQAEALRNALLDKGTQ